MVASLDHRKLQVGQAAAKKHDRWRDYVVFNNAQSPQESAGAMERQTALVSVGDAGAGPMNPELALLFGDPRKGSCANPVTGGAQRDAVEHTYA